MKKYGFYPIAVLLLLVPALCYAQFFSVYEAPMRRESWLDAHTQWLIAAVLGGLVGAFFSEKFKKFRRILFYIIAVIVFLAAITSSVYLGDIAIFVAAMALASHFLRNNIAGAKKKTLYGSAEWADFEHLQKHGLIGKAGLNFGVYLERGQAQPLQYKGNRHLLTVAPTRSGKGVSAIIPNLLNYEGSALVIDPKGENALITAARRGEGSEERNIPGLKQKVHVVDPWGITGIKAACFNPLDWLRKGDPDISENAMMLADSIVTPREGGLDPFWDEEAKALLMGIVLHVALDDKETGKRNLGRVRDILTLPDKTPQGSGVESFNDVMMRMVDSDNPVIGSTARRTLSKEPKLLGSVLAALQSHTHFLDSPRIRENLSKSDFKFEDLKTTAMTVYLVLPADRLDTFGRWLRLLVQQAITVNARNINVKPKKPILFLLDEMPALGRLKMVEQAYGLMAGFGIQLWGIVQDLSQLERVYDKGWETFIGNSGVLQYFGSRDHKTAEYFSKLCGVSTIEKVSFTQNIARSISKLASGGRENESESNSQSRTVDVIQRQLMFPDELMVMRDNRQLLMIESYNPIDCRRVNWYEDESLKRLGISQHKEGD